MKIVEEICSEKMNLFIGVSLLAYRRNTDLGNDFVGQLKETAKSFKYFSIALVESTDSLDLA